MLPLPSLLSVICVSVSCLSAVDEYNIPDLSGDNFTFMKKAIYRLPEEFVRMAGKAGLGKRVATTAPPPSKYCAEPIADLWL